MPELYFVTGNARKLREVQELIPDVQSLDIDLPEIQSDDPREIIAQKLSEARHRAPINGLVVVEDVSLHIKALNEMPGPLVKWFMKALGDQGIYEIVAHKDDTSAVVRATIGLSEPNGNVHFFEGTVEGKIVAPTYEEGCEVFGFDPIFYVNAVGKTFAQMTVEEKNTISHRGQAWRLVKEYLTAN